MSLHRIVFMGTPDFAVPSLEALIGAGYEVAGVFTQPDRPRGRSGKPAFSPVKECALAHGIEVFQPQRLRGEEKEQVLRTLRELEPDAIVVAAYGQIIPKEILELPRYGCINVHASLLPKYRGAAPIQWAVINGEKESGVTIMQMGEGLDTGDILGVFARPLEPDETGGSLFDKLMHDGAQLLVRTLKELEAGSVVPRRQPEESPTDYAGMLKKEMGLIDWTKSAREIERLVRGLDPWPSAYTYLDGKQLKIWKAGAAQLPDGAEAAGTGDGKEGAEPAGSGPCAPGTVPETQPGTVVRTGRTSFFVQTGDGLLEVLAVQAEGKKRMDADAFLRGHALKAGTRLGAAD